nr:hypothetical protein [Bacteroidota bacterium]
MKKTILFGLLFFSLFSCKRKYVEVIPTVSSTQLSSPVSSDLNSVCFISSSEGFIGGVNGKIYRTNDGGNSWASISMSSSAININKVLFQNSLKGLVATNAGIYLTIDGGVTWSNQLPEYISDLNFVTSNIGYAIGVGSFSVPAKIYKTFDGGTSWTQCNSTLLYSNLHAVSFVNQDTGYIAGDNAKFFETTDGGSSWSAFICDSKWQGKGYSDKIYDLYFTGYRTGYLVG